MTPITTRQMQLLINKTNELYNSYDLEWTELAELIYSARHDKALHGELDINSLLNESSCMEIDEREAYFDKIINDMEG